MTAIFSILPNKWDSDPDMMDEELSEASSEEASKVFEQWHVHEHNDDDLVADMEVDSKIGSVILGDDDFSPPSSPTGPLDEFYYATLEEHDHDLFSSSSSIFGDSDKTPGNLSFHDRYLLSIQKLADSMKRSNKTRKSLLIKTEKTSNYERSSTICGVISSVEKSSQELKASICGTCES